MFVCIRLCRICGSVHIGQKTFTNRIPFPPHPHCTLANACWVLNTVVVQYEEEESHPAHWTAHRSVRQTYLKLDFAAFFILAKLW